MSAEAAVDARTGAFSRLWAWLDDRVNPILVKEVRQALRGRYFRNMFWLTVVGATAISLFTILDFDSSSFLEHLGVDFFLVNYGVLVVAVNAFVPFWAFQSMSGEWEENTYDLLVISNLRPKQLLLGKFLAAFVQSLLFTAAFAPYLVSTFLMGGVDLVSILVVLPATLMVSGALSIVALAIASFGRSRLARAVLAVGFIGILLGLVGTTVTLATILIRQPESLRDSEFRIVAGVFVSIVVLVAALAFGLGCARLAHEHENRSTFLRAIVAAISFVMLGWAIWIYFFTGAHTSSPGPLELLPAAAQAIVILPFLFFVTEVEPLGRRTVKQVPKSRLLALLSMPFLPGGARGLWLYVAISIVTLIAVAAVSALSSSGFGSALPHSMNTDDTLMMLVVMFGYGFVTLGLLSGIASFHIRSLRGRTGVRVAIPFAVLLACVVPTLLGFLFDDRAWRDFEHPFNPFWTLEQVMDGQEADVASGLAFLALAALVTLVVNIPRLFGAIAETLAASDARRARERTSEPTS